METEQTDTPVEELTLEEALEEVRTIIDTFEDGEIDLPEANTLYERGNELLVHIESELEVNDGDVERITED